MDQIKLVTFLFADESRFCLDFADRRGRVWKRLGERFHTANIAQHYSSGSGSVMVSDGTSWDRWTDLIVLNRGTLTGKRYSYDMLDTQVRLYAGTLGDFYGR